MAANYSVVSRRKRRRRKEEKFVPLLANRFFIQLNSTQKAF
jgi:hypothetical protein